MIISHFVCFRWNCQFPKLTLFQYFIILMQGHFQRAVDILAVIMITPLSFCGLVKGKKKTIRINNATFFFEK